MASVVGSDSVDDAIVAVDWAGDEFYPVPHIYCWFETKYAPDEAVLLYERGIDDHLFLRDDLHYKPQRRSRLRQWRDHRALRRAQLEFERQALTD